MGDQLVALESGEAIRGDAGEALVGLRLIERRVRLVQIRLGLGEAGAGLRQARARLGQRGARLAQLLIQLGRVDLGQGLPRRDAVADVDVALTDVAAGA